MPKWSKLPPFANFRAPQCASAFVWLAQLIILSFETLITWGFTETPHPLKRLGELQRSFARIRIANSGDFDHLDADCGQNCRHSQSMVRRPCLSSKVLRLRTGKSCAFALTLGKPAPSRRQRRLSQSRLTFPEIEKGQERTPGLKF